MIPLTSQIPQTAVIAGVLVYVINTFIPEANIASDQVEAIISAISLLVVTFASLWSWISNRKTLRENHDLKETVASLSAQVAGMKAPAKVSARKSFGRSGR
jgi:ABC-type nickel/cobalt efflux system permease component RcnA